MPRSGLKVIIKRWENIDRFLEALLADLCKQMVAVLRQSTPGTVFPTQWTYTVSRQSGKIVAEVFNTRLGSQTQPGQDEAFERIAFYLNEGTDLHEIKPVVAQALHWEEDGQDFFSQGHVVSGIKASHFREKADRVIEEFQSTIQGKFEDYINRGRMPG